MAIYDGFDVELTDKDITELVGEPQPGPAVYVTDRDVYEERRYPGTNIVMRYLLWPRWTKITEAEYQYMLESAKDDPAEPPA